MNNNLLKRVDKKEQKIFFKYKKMQRIWIIIYSICHLRIEVEYEYPSVNFSSNINGNIEKMQIFDINYPIFENNSEKHYFTI